MVVQCGDLIRTWRKKQKLSYKDLSEQSGVSTATLSRWETGRTQPRMAELDAVFTALHVSAAQRQQALGLLESPRALERLRETAGGGPPVSGDLLRAMRLRRGWTQQETAARAGISQGTLARWERSQDWPSSERLHTLCYVLQAREAELIALTHGLQSAAPPLEAAPDRDEIRTRVAQYMLYSPIADLEFLALETQLWHLSSRHASAQLQLSYTYGCHARYLVEHQRFDEAAPYVERTQQMATSGYREDIGWAATIVAASRIVGLGGRPLHLKRAMNLLHTWAERPPVSQYREYQAWMTSEMALYLSKMGHAESALFQSRRAIQIAGSVNSVEVAYRRGDHAKVLQQLGRYHEAVEECRACLDQRHPPLESLPFMLTGVQALLGACLPAEAAEWLQRIYRIIDTHPEGNHHLPLADSLKQRL